ncbi:MAG: helix-turn-helix domain-containing protein [bacterium]|nr:helix-turn-helix domain-containing protein [bacterium]
MKNWFVFLSNLLLVIFFVQDSFGAEPVVPDKHDPGGLYIGKYIEYLSEGDLFGEISGGWEAEKIFKDKMLSGELHSDDRFNFTVSATPGGYRAHMRLRDRPGESTIEWGLGDILKKDIRTKFKPCRSHIPRFNFMPHSWWLTFRIHNTEQRTRELYLEVDKYFFGFAHLFVQNEGEISVKRADFVHAMKQREVKYKNIVFPIKVRPGLNTCYMRIDSWFIDVVPLRLWSRESFYYSMSVDSLLLGIMAGMFFLVFLYTLFIFISTRDKSYLYLSIMTMCGFMIHVSASGMGFQFLWPGNSPASLFILFLAFPLSFVFTLLFSRSFIEIYRYTPMINKLVLGMIIFFTALVPVLFLLPAGAQKVLFGFIFIADYFYYLPVVYSAIVVIRRGNRYGLFLLMGLVFYFLSQVEWILSSFDITPYRFINYLHIKGISFVLIMTLGLGYKLKGMRSLIAGYRERLREWDRKFKGKTITDSTKIKIERVKEFLRENYREDISREGLAAAVDISPDHLGRIFKQDTGEKIAEFINTLRVEEAAQRLRKTDILVIEIAFEIGFESLRTFNKVFRDRMNMTPSEYRKRTGD